MAIWQYPVEFEITGETRIKDADNKIQSAMNDMENWANSVAPYAGVGFGSDAISQFNTDGALAIDALQAAADALIDDTVVTEW